jgi:hypothetical protein
MAARRPYVVVGGTLFSSCETAVTRPSRLQLWWHWHALSSVQQPVRGQGYYAAFYADPDGMKVEVVYEPHSNP